jgi:hypothetical protein
MPTFFVSLGKRSVPAEGGYLIPGVGFRDPSLLRAGAFVLRAHGYWE